MCIAESHLSRDKLIHVKNYNWFGYNRTVKHIKSSIIHGGIGILVWDSLLKLFTVNIIDKQVDGILGIQLSNKSTGYSYLVYRCYLPPKNSPWAEPYKFFGHLISQLYVNSSVETVIICGDFNARIGKEIDCANFDKIPNRLVIDSNKNTYCEIFLEFLKDSKCCILNGRFKKDNFTSTHWGNAVVDYIITPHDCF